MPDDEILDVDDEGKKSPDDQVAFSKVRVELESRCKAAGIKVEDDESFEGMHFVSVHLPAGRDTQEIVLADGDRISQFLAIEFEKYTCLKNYLAICSYSDGVIEAAIRSQGVPSLPIVFPEILQQRKDMAIGAQDASHLELSNPLAGKRLSLAPALKPSSV